MFNNTHNRSKRVCIITLVLFKNFGFIFLIKFNNLYSKRTLGENMNIQRIAIAFSINVFSASIYAGALDISGQSIAPFFQEGNYFETSISALDAKVSGKIRPQYAVPESDLATGNIVKNDTFYNAALKLQVSPIFSFGLIYDQPFGAEVDQPYKNNGTFNDSLDTTKVSVNTQNLTMLWGYQPSVNWNLFAGPVYQTVEGNVQLPGLAYSVLSGYKSTIKQDSGIGWVAGIAYQIPEIALKSALTYRSEINHEFSAKETFNELLSPLQLLVGTGITKVTTPQSVNFDFQTGINPTSILFLNARWVNWKDFSIRPYQFGKVSEIITTSTYNYTKGFDLVNYSKDQWTFNLGLGHKLTDKWDGILFAGWDSGAGDPVSTLGPTEGYWAAGLGFQYNPTKEYFIAGGLKYFWLGDATGQNQSYSIPGNAEYAKVADFSDNNAIGYTLKIGYKF